jgi:hypothetical protein
VYVVDRNTLGINSVSVSIQLYRPAVLTARKATVSTGKRVW